jgi:hypothetical protein
MRRPTPARLTGLAVFVVVAFLFRHDHGFYLGAATLAMILLTPADAGRQAVRRAAAFCLAVGVLLAPYVVFIELHGGVLEYVRDGLQYWHREMDRTQLRLAAATPDETLLFVGLYLLPLAAVAWHGIDRLRSRTATGEIVLPLVVMALLVDLGFLRDPLGARLRDAIVPAVLVGAWLTGRARRVSAPGWRGAALAAAVLAGALGARAVFAVANTGEILQRTSLGLPINRTPALFVQKTGELAAPRSARQMPDEGVARLMPFFEYLDRCTPRHYRLLVAAYAPDVFVFARRPFAGGERFFIEGYQRPAIQRRVIDRMHDQVVAFVLMPSDTARAWRAVFAELNAFVEARFSPMAVIETHRGTTQVLVNASLPPVGRDGPTGWPCYT